MPGSGGRNAVCCGERPATENSPTGANCSGNWAANSADAIIVRPSLAANFSSRAARLTAGPMQVKSSRLPPPMLPYITWPDMQRKAEAYRALIHCDAAAREVGHPRVRLARACKGARAYRPGIAFISAQREDRQQPVAHEFKHFAAVFGDRRNLAIEILIKKVDQRLRRQSLGERGKPAHVGQPDRSAQGLDMPATDLAGENSLAGLVADIGLDQVAGGASQRPDFRHPGQRRDHGFKRGELLCRKAQGLAC